MRMSELERAFLLLVIGAGVFLRFAYPSFIEFKGDELNAVALAYRQFSHGIALTGLPSSVGIANPPAFIWLLALPVALSLHPPFVTLWIMATNVAGLGLFFSWIRRLLSRDIALRATALLATSPWAILYSRKIWAQDLLIPFLMGFCVLVVSHWQRPRAWKLVAASATFAIASQLHMSVWFALPSLAVAFAVFRPRVRPRDMLLAVIPFLLLYSPYVVHLFGEGAALGGGSDEGVIAWIPWFFQMPMGLGFTYVLGDEGFRAFASIYPVGLFTGIFVLGALLIASVCIESVWHLMRARSRADRMTLVCVLVIASVLLGYAASGIAVYPHYFILLLPLIPFLVVLSLHRLAGIAPMAARCVRVFLAVVVTAQILFMLLFFRFIVHSHDRISGDYGVPFLYQHTQLQP